MSIEVQLADHFKPEDRKRGEDLFAQDVVIVSSATDTTVKALIKVSGAPRISLEADDVSSPLFNARCSCPSFAKGHACKHLWATLLKLEQRDADFLSGKTRMDLSAVEARPKVNERQLERLVQQKERAKEMRREQKARRAPKTAASPPSKSRPNHPEPVTEALAYFLTNGFDLAGDLTLDQALNAKRILSRVFHPDKGGTHEEAIVLNENFEILREYLNS